MVPENHKDDPRDLDGWNDPLADADGFDLDEDLFDFGEVFDSIPEPSAPTSKPIAKPSYDEAPAAKVSGTAPSSTATSRQGSSSDLVDLDAASTLTPTPAATSKSSSAPVRGTTDQPARASEGFDPRTAPAAPTSETPARKSRIVEVLAICFLVVNVSMVFFAWRAGDEFRQTLAHVSGSCPVRSTSKWRPKTRCPFRA